ncbi:amiloride-sensitive amine oxidase [copper-containing]-like isoform X2 [Micractinium conductrix]|uniref:Amine oxidase n=1 Tax=Micractinium conductrix TaxID=554055 RepID=A0A2P6VDY2_9CHLO|nr:amiloride-sensitive amine oxidase [copper-containing]-like isoform X2 [Micractinium conductrix]|eukprot:PSC72271.1 amiloride-sensitive amine oxidase [copper-containing]-like isoform X2 [Micractinium conductrix]
MVAKRLLLALALALVLATHYRALQAAEGAAGTCRSGPRGGIDPKPVRASIFNELTVQEIYAVLRWTLKKFPGTKYQGDIPGPGGQNGDNVDILPTDNYIYRVILKDPPKQAALAYLDNRGPKPARMARVIIVRGAAKPRDVMEYAVGPLPLGPGAKATPLFKPGQVPYVKKPEDAPEHTLMEEKIGDAADQMKTLFRFMTSSPANSDKCYGPADECNSDYFGWWCSASLLEDGTKRVSNIQWWFQARGAKSGNELNLMPLPLYMRIDVTSPNYNNWRIFDLVYCNQGPFATPAALMAAFNAGKIKKCTTPYGKPGYDDTWTRTDVARGTRVRESAAIAGPRTIWPEGQRFGLKDAASQTGRGFTYMGWEGHVTVDPYTGIQFHDIKFKGRRVLYELALKELYAQYAGVSMPGQVTYFDSVYGIGSNARPLRPGLDCPENAEYMGVSFLSYDAEVGYMPRVVCFFEDDLGQADWRHTHTDATPPHVDGVRSSALTIRFVTTPAYWDPVFGTSAPDRAYMPRVQGNTAGVLHDHLGLWKVDLDVTGAANRLVKKSVHFGSYKQAGVFNEPGWGYKDGFKYMKEELIPKEAGFSYDYKVPAVYQVQSMTEKNKWGSPKAYTVSVGYTTSQLLPPGHPIARAMAWSTNHLWATVQKDNEEHGHYSIYDQHSSRRPAFSFNEYVDGESIMGKDIVLWVTMGAQHVPRSEDVPLITNHGTHMTIKPFNYFDELPTMDIVDKKVFGTCTTDLGYAAQTTWRPN